MPAGCVNNSARRGGGTTASWSPSARSAPLTSMRVVAWNVGGGGRLNGIAERLEALRPDIVVICDYRASEAGAKLRGFLATIGLDFQVASETVPRSSGLLAASRTPIDHGAVDSPPVPASWLHVAGLPFELGAVHGPASGADPTTRSAQDRWWAWLGDAVAAWRHRPALLCGSFNAGRHWVDEPGCNFAAARQFERLLDTGWRDLYREQHGERRAWSSWTTEGTPRRADHALASPALAAPVQEVHYAPDGGLTEGRPLVVDVAC